MAGARSAERMRKTKTCRPMTSYASRFLPPTVCDGVNVERADNAEHIANLEPVDARHFILVVNDYAPNALIAFAAQIKP
jgi:hypothetical protein